MLDRRNWLKQSSLAALGLGFGLPSMANEEGLQRNFGAANGLINLGANENPYGISPKARQAIMDMMTESNRYQFNVSSLQGFSKELARYYHIGDDQVLLTAGSGDALKMLARHFSKGNLVTAFPTFNTLPATAKKIGTKVIEIPLTAGKVHDLPAMLKAITSETQLVYICNPANPTGTIVSPEDLKNFCLEAAKKATVVIDEAYIDFLNPPDNQSMMTLAGQNSNIIVVRTFSKIHAMAGLRIGFVVGHPDTINALDAGNFANSQMTVSNLTMAAALASLQDEGHRETCKQKNAAARSYTSNALKEMNIQYIPSYTNFIFFPLKNYSGDFARDMIQKNVLLRFNNYPDGKFARVSIGTIDEMKQFIELSRPLLKGF